MNVFCIADRNQKRSMVVIDHFGEFLRHIVDGGYKIENGEIIIRKLLFEIKGKLKTKKLLKTTILDEQEPSLQSADRYCKFEVEKICIYQKPGN